MSNFWYVFGLLASYVAGYATSAAVVYMELRRGDLSALVDAAFEQVADLHDLACEYWMSDNLDASGSVNLHAAELRRKLDFRMAYMTVLIDEIQRATEIDDSHSAYEVLSLLNRAITADPYDSPARKADMGRLAEISIACRRLVTFLAGIRGNHSNFLQVLLFPLRLLRILKRHPRRD